MGNSYRDIIQDGLREIQRILNYKFDDDKIKIKKTKDAINDLLHCRRVTKLQEVFDNKAFNNLQTVIDTTKES